MQAIILAGGFGTRLKSKIDNLPKPMAPINGVPFLKILFDYLNKFNINKVVLAVGYKYHVIASYFGNKYKNIEIIYSVENTPLGTGGCIRKALVNTEDNHILVLNGDSFFDIDLISFFEKHIEFKADVSISVKYLNECSRYGLLTIDGHRVKGFKEKQMFSEWYINAGVYVINRNIFDDKDLGDSFSFEKDFMELSINKLNVCAYNSDDYFIDIGVPEDYRRAQLDLGDRV